MTPTDRLERHQGDKRSTSSAARRELHDMGQQRAGRQGCPPHPAPTDNEPALLHDLSHCPKALTLLSHGLWMQKTTFSRSFIYVTSDTDR